MFFNSAKKRKPSFRLALFCVVFTFFVVGLGAFTRLVDAGLGCPDWPTCYGHVLWPKTDEQTKVANEAFKNFNPNLDASVQHDKTWPEQVHRIFASTLGLLSITLVGLALFNRKRVNQPIKLPIFILGFIILQGVFGKWTVDWLVWPQVVTAHLLGGFILASLLWLLTLRLNNQTWWLPLEAATRVKKVKPVAFVFLLVVFLQIALGGWTTSNYADVACPELPTCQGEWIPQMDFSQGFNIFQDRGPNYLGGKLDNQARMAIHFSHRVGAIITSFAGLFLMLLLWRTCVSEARRMGMVLFGALLLQVLLGLSNIIFKFPVAVAVAHNLGGLLLLLVTVTLLHRLITLEER